MQEKYVLPVFAVTVFASGVALAQGFTLTRGTVTGGGGIVSTGGNFSLGGSIGQPIAGSASGGNFTLGSGFWGGGSGAPSAPSSYTVYLPITMKNSP